MVETWNRGTVISQSGHGLVSRIRQFKPLSQCPVFFFRFLLDALLIQECSQRPVTYVDPQHQVRKYKHYVHGSAPMVDVDTAKLLTTTPKLLYILSNQISSCHPLFEPLRAKRLPRRCRQLLSHNNPCIRWTNASVRHWSCPDIGDAYAISNYLQVPH